MTLTQQSLIAILSANMIIAVTCLKEKLRPEDLFGSALAVVGAFLLVFFSQKVALFGKLCVN